MLSQDPEYNLVLKISTSSRSQSPTLGTTCEIQLENLVVMGGGDWLKGLI